MPFFFSRDLFTFPSEIDPLKGSDPGLPEVEDAMKRLEGLRKG